MNRLKTAQENSGASWSQTYDCDRWGNRAVRAGSYIPPENIGLTPQSANSTDFSAFDQSTNRLKQQTYPNVMYDASGNLTKDIAANTLSYDAENRLVSFNSGAGQYFYDGDGRRVKKIVSTGTTVFVYNLAGQMIAEYTTGAGSGSGTSYLTADHLGSTRVVTDGSGNVKARYDYLPFGEKLGAGIGGRTTGMKYDAADSTRQLFTGKERDGESGLDYFLARYYSSAQGRFTSPDEFQGGPEEFWILGSEDPEEQALPYADIAEPQSLNKYQYCLNNPIKYIDPDGHGQQDQESNQAGRAIQGVAVHVAAVAVQEAHVRAEYNRRKANTRTSKERRDLQLEMRKHSTPLGKALAEAHDRKSQPKLALKTPEQASESVQRTNPRFNKAGGIAGAVGKVLLVGGVANSVYNVATAPEGQKGEAIVQEGGAWAGALAGGAVGAKGGAWLGGLTGNPLVAAGGAVVGGIIGSAVGAVAGSGAVKEMPKISQDAFIRKFTPTINLFFR